MKSLILIYPKCKETYDNEDYKFCPKCSTKLEEDYSYNFVMSMMKKFSKLQRKICKNCDEVFIDEDYNFCPFCSQELEPEKIFTVDTEKRIVFGKWNEDSISISFEDLYCEYSTEYHPFDLPRFFGIFLEKSEWDEKLEHDLKNTSEEVQKLTFYEVKQLMIHFGGMGVFHTLKEIIGFKTFDSIKHEYFNNKTPINFGEGYYIKLNDEEFIIFLEVRKKKLYYLSRIISDTLDDDW